MRRLRSAERGRSNAEMARDGDQETAVSRQLLSPAQPWRTYLAIADALHHPAFVLVHPGGGVWSKAFYLDGIADGSIDYRRFEPMSDIDAFVDGDLAVLRYRSAIEIHVHGQQGGDLDCWHMDTYRRDNVDAPWRAIWSQATEIK